MNELRDKIARICRVMIPSEKRADLILAIPEIAEALAANTDEARQEAYRNWALDDDRG